MAHWLFKPWRLGCVAAGLALPAAALLAVSIWGGPGILRWDPPDPGVVAARYRNASATADAGDLETALSDLDALRAQDAFNGIILARMAKIHHQAGRTPEAIATAQAAVAVDSRFGEAFYNLACYLLQAGRPEAALQALHNAVAVGFDARTAAKNDPDLDLLDDDPRWLVYLHGADVVPLSARTATWTIAPGDILVGVPFTLTLSVVALDRPATDTSPSVSVEYLGPEIDHTLAPVSAYVDRSVVEQGTEQHHVWTFRYRVTSWTATPRRLGPWEIQIDGVRLNVEDPVLAARAMPPLTPNLPLEYRDGTVAFRPRPFFRWPPRREPTIGKVAWLNDGGLGAWSSGGVAVQVCRIGLDEPGGIDIEWHDSTNQFAHYDVWTGPGTWGVSPCFSRVFAVSRDAVETFRKRPVHVLIDGVAARLPARRDEPDRSHLEWTPGTTASP